MSGVNIYSVETAGSVPVSVVHFLFRPDADLLCMKITITVIAIAIASILIIANSKSSPNIRACNVTSKKAR